MKVIKITKSYLNGKNNHNIIINDELANNESIEYLVEEWCRNDAAGQIYGYDYSWVEVTDRNEIAETLDKKMKELANRIFRLEKERDDMAEFRLEFNYDNRGHALKKFKV